MYLIMRRSKHYIWKLQSYRLQWMSRRSWTRDQCNRLLKCLLVFATMTVSQSYRVILLESDVTNMKFTTVTHLNYIIISVTIGEFVYIHLCSVCCQEQTMYCKNKNKLCKNTFFSMWHNIHLIRYICNIYIY